MGGGHHHELPDHTTINPKWFDGLEPNTPIENPIKPGQLFPPQLDGPNAPSEEEYKTGKVGGGRRHIRDRGAGHKAL